MYFGILRDGLLENLRGGGWGRSTKKYSRKRKLSEKKNSCTPINPKKYLCYHTASKNSYKEIDNEKNS